MLRKCIPILLVGVLGCGEVAPPPAGGPAVQPQVNAQRPYKAPVPGAAEPADVKRSESKDVIQMTASAMKRVRELKREAGARFLRLKVRGDQATGLSIELKLDDWADPEKDLIDWSQGIAIVVDRKSAGYLAGTLVDWQEVDRGEGFSFKSPKLVPAATTP